MPVLVVVMVNVLAPVNRVPDVIFTVAAVMSFTSDKLLVEADLFTVRILKVVAPVIVALLAPVNCTVPVEAV